MTKMKHDPPSPKCLV